MSKIPKAALRRRSKSVTDLSVLSERPFNYLRRFGSKRDILNENASVGTSKLATNKNMPAKSATGSKRPVLACSNNVDGPSKPKITKKIPEWDYKGRFNQLKERYTHAQEAIKSMKERINGFEEIETNYGVIQKESKELADAKAALTEKYETLCLKYEAIKIKYNTLQDSSNIMEKDNKELRDRVTLLEEDNEKLIKETATMTKEIIRLRDSLTESTAFGEQLTNDYEETKISHKKLEEQIKYLGDVVGRVKMLEEETATQKEYLQKYQKDRRWLHNVIQELKGNIRVFCRIRPPINSSEMELMQCSISYNDTTGLEIRKTRESVSQITGKSQDFKGDFTFDRVFPPDSSQEEVFEDLAQLVQSALDGYNVCVFAYGQTGSGKTYTMQGEDGPTHMGMIPRTIDLIFATIEELNKSGWKYTVHASFLEIYNENIHDLLNINNPQKLEILYNEGKGTTVTNLLVQPMNSATDLKQYMMLAHKNRATATTDFNEHSSRSHAVTKIYLEGALENAVLKGSINLVDLAGSESAKTTINEERLTETKNINKSLATLGDVISALYSKSKHVPYRNSKLTYLLQSSLGGNSKTLMVVNVSPFEDCFNETINSLRFAAKVKEVKTGCKKNKVTLQPSQSKY